MECCPPGSHPQAANVLSWSCPTKHAKISEGLTADVFGDVSEQTAILVLHDAFGVDSGRTKNLCAQFAESLNAMVILPDLFRGNPIVPSRYEPIDSGSCCQVCGVLCHVFCCCGYCGISRRFKEQRSHSLHQDVMQILSSDCMRGKRIAVVSFCWGGWMAVHVSSLPKICCSVSFHPAFEMFTKVGEDPTPAFHEVI